jgi:hypothetical protein
MNRTTARLEANRGAAPEARATEVSASPKVYRMATIEEYAEEMFKIFDTVDSVEEQTNALAELRDRMGADIGMVKEAHKIAMTRLKDKGRQDSAIMRASDAKQSGKPN